MTRIMQDAFAAFLHRPTIRRYKQLRLLTATLVDPSAFSMRLVEMQQMLDEERYADVIALAGEALPQGLLSLRLHRLAGCAAQKLGDNDRAEAHRLAYDAVLCVIRDSGRGTKASPLTIAWTSDEYEWAASLEKRVLSQMLVEDAEQRFDVLLLEEEREVWFDVTDLLPVVVPKPQPARRRRGATATSNVRPVVNRNRR